MSADRNNSSHPSQRPLSAIILAAGKGKRMNSDLPKVVHEVAGQPMVRWVVDAVRQMGANPIVLVIGHGADEVRRIFQDDADVTFVTQDQQLGTGHAVDQARDIFQSPVLNHADVVVLAGDGPLIRAATLKIMLDRHRQTGAVATLATSIIPDPAGYGRIVRDASNRLSRIVEHKDASPEQRQIQEINPSYYCFQATPLFDMLKLVDNKNANGEYYITDVFTHMLGKGMRVEVIDAVPPEDVLSINDPAQLAEVDSILKKRPRTKRSFFKAQVQQ